MYCYLSRNNKKENNYLKLSELTGQLALIGENYARQTDAYRRKESDLEKGLHEANVVFNKFKKTPQTLENVLVKDRSIIKNPDVKKSIKKAEKLMNGNGRILVRASGTESKIRVMGESENKQLLDKCINIILKKIK